MQNISKKDVKNRGQKRLASGAIDFGRSIEVVRVCPRTPDQGGDDIRVPAPQNEENARIERANHCRRIQLRESEEDPEVGLFSVHLFFVHDRI